MTDDPAVAILAPHLTALGLSMAEAQAAARAWIRAVDYAREVARE